MEIITTETGVQIPAAVLYSFAECLEELLIKETDSQESAKENAEQKP